MRATEKFQKKAPLVCVRSLLLCAASLLCIGATEFPEFDTGDFEEAIDERDYFEPESKTSFDIPAVSERFYGTDIPRLPIISIQMDEVRAFPALGITQESVQALVNAEFERQQGIELDENGFTDRNQKDIGRFLRELIDRGGRPDQRDMNDLMGLMRQVETQASWITVEQLDAIAQAVTSFYRQKGLILATAYIPEQQVANGVVHLKVLEGRLGEVTVSGNASYHEDFIKSPFINDLGDPVTDRGIEGSLRRINDSPGLRVRGSFSPG
ncbi:MAG: hypothetical protein OEZ23_06750, partial [Gammaproteobacteria bacterium]|nr:hypothetical protein [Gammaproteobacteria bacterium]